MDDIETVTYNGITEMLEGMLNGCQEKHIMAEYALWDALKDFLDRKDAE